MSDAQAGTLESLQEELKNEIERLAEQRRAEAIKFEKELAERNKIAEIERQERIKQHEEAERKHRERRLKEIEEAQSKHREAERIRVEMEREQNEALERKQALDRTIEWLVEEIAKQEHLEEQHQKFLENQKSTPVLPDNPTEINVEHPTAPISTVEPGGAVEQTGGIEVEPTTMSVHLRHILRQAARPQ